MAQEKKTPAKSRVKASSKKKTPVKKKSTEKTAREKQRENTVAKCKKILVEIQEGISIRKALKKNRLSSSTFYEWIEEDEKNAKHFARALEIRENLLIEECIDIADERDKDATAFVGGNYIQRAKLRVQTRLDVLARLNPKKYGNKVDVTSQGEKIEMPLFPDVTTKKED